MAESVYIPNSRQMAPPSGLESNDEQQSKLLYLKTLIESAGLYETLYKQSNDTEDKASLERCNSMAKGRIDACKDCLGHKITLPNGQHTTLLHIAIESGSSLIYKLIEAIDPQYLNKQDSEGYTPLALADKCTSITIVQYRYTTAQQNKDNTCASPLNKEDVKAALRDKLRTSDPIVTPPLTLTGTMRNNLKQL